MTPMMWLLVIVAILAALWFSGVRLPGRQGGCPYAGTSSCSCGGAGALPPMPRSSEDLLTRM